MERGGILMKGTFENLTKKAIDNIESDRKVTEDLLNDLQSQINNDSDINPGVLFTSPSLEEFFPSSLK